MVDRVLERMGATVCYRGAIYKSVEQFVLLYGIKTWVVTREMLKVLKGFHYLAARRITVLTEKRRAGGEWEYPSVVKEMKSTGLHPVGVYIRRRKATIAERVACRPIYELCMEAERMPGRSRLMKWCDQDVVNKPED